MIGLGVAGNFAHQRLFLSIYSVASDELKLSEYEANAQVEPKIGVQFEVVYGDDHEAVNLIAERFMTFNDCTIRKEDAKKYQKRKTGG